MTNYFNFETEENKIELAHALSKFYYEMNMRKKEYMNLCLKYDLDFSSKMTKIYFDVVLDNFTCYLNRKDKELIINHFLVNDSYINYLDVTNSSTSGVSKEEYTYHDPFLNHLNSFSKENKIRNVGLNTKRIARVVDIKPLEMLNYEISEENFMIKIAKKIMEYIIIHSADFVSNREFFNPFFSQFDFDKDNKYTIGELNNLLIYVGIELQDHDLRYFFESLKIENGKFRKNTLYDFIFQMASNNYKTQTNTEFVNVTDQNKIFSQDEINDENKLRNILKENYLIYIIKESIQVLGKSYLLKYFSQYFEIIDNISYVEMKWLELGYKHLGYKDEKIHPLDKGNFKYFLIKKLIGILKNETTIYIKFENLIDFIIKEFQLSEFSFNDDMKHKNHNKSNSVEGMSSIIFRDISNVFLSYLIESEYNNINEFEFRKKIIRNFGFIDHQFFNNIVKNISKSKKIENNQENFLFKIEHIDTKEWLRFIYNILFIGMVKNHNHFELCLDIEDIVQLNTISNKMEMKIFHDFNITENKNVMKEINLDINDNSFKNINKTDIKKSNTVESHSQPTLSHSQKVINLNRYKTQSVVGLKDNFIDKKYFHVESKDNLLKNKINIHRFNVNDTPSLIPELFNYCVCYLKDLYNLEKINFEILSKLGCCKIFRDFFIKSNIDLSKELNCNLFMNHLQRMQGMTDSIYKFLQFYCENFKSKNNLLSAQYFFMKLEDILLQFSKLHK